jgi:tetraacyldisaccharide 4'-kinase
MMARALSGVSVLVGKDRRRTGREAIERTGAQVLVLDDGFQYQRLVKDVEIVLVDALAPFGYDFLVPRGRLREPVGSLARANAVWLTHADLVRERDLAELRARVEALAPKARVWEARHEPVRLRRLEGTEEEGVGALRGRRVVALSSVGNPVAFERTLGQLGAVVVGRARFPDHHRYRREDVRGLPSERPEDLVVTTEKDAVRLPTGGIGREVWVLEVDLEGRVEGRGLSEELAWLLDAQRRT